MEKIKRIFSNISINAKEIINKFPITLTIIAVTTILYVSLLDIEFIKNVTVYKIAQFGTILAFGSIVTEICINNKKNKIFFIVLSAIISFGFINLLNYSDIDNINNTKFIQELTDRVLAFYIISILLYSVYKLIKRSEIGIEKYGACVFYNLFITGIIYTILAIGFLIISAIFVFLILENDSANIILKLQVLLFGLYYVPSLIYSFTSVNKNDENKISRNLVVYILLPLVTISMAIIYMYIIKIAIQQYMPENFVYRIIAGIFVIAFPMWTIAGNYKTESKFAKIMNKILPYLFIPLIILEIYSISLRILNYGITPLRYISVMFIIFQVIAISFSIYKNKERMKYIFIYAIVLVAITTISPLNSQMISNLSQKSIIDNNLKATKEYSELDKETKKKVLGAYRYLKGVANSDKYIPNYLSNDIESLEDLSKTKEYRDVYCNIDASNINIEGYKTLTRFEFNEKGENTYNVYSRLDDNSRLIKSEYIKEYIQTILSQQEEKQKAHINNNNEIIVNENKIIITSIYMTYDIETKELIYLSMDGFWLEK